MSYLRIHVKDTWLFDISKSIVTTQFYEILKKNFVLFFPFQFYGLFD